MHWSLEYAATALIDTVVNPATDPLSGQPESKHTPVRVEPCRPAWHGFVISRHELDPEAGFGPLSYRVSVRGQHCWRYELAGEAPPPEGWARAVRGAFRPRTETADGARTLQWLEYLDAGGGHYRAAAVAGERLQACFFLGPSTRLPSRQWLGALFDGRALSREERLRLLAGHQDGGADAGPVVCSCFQVGLNTLVEAIGDQGLTSPEALGRALRAGTNCGSCLPELRGLIARHAGKREQAA